MLIMLWQMLFDVFVMKIEGVRFNAINQICLRFENIIRSLMFFKIYTYIIHLSFSFIVIVPRSLFELLAVMPILDNK